MHVDKLIGGSKNITNNKGYIALWPEFDMAAFPDSVSFGDEVFVRKDYFHVSLLCVKNILEQYSNLQEKEVVDVFSEYLKGHEIKFQKFTGELRMAVRNERKSIVAGCKVAGLDELSELLFTRLAVGVAEIPFHVTMYTLQPNMGIGLNGPEDLNRMSTVIQVPELDAVIDEL